MVQGEVAIPLELKPGMGPHLQMRWETRGSSQVVVGNSGFLSRFDGDFWAPMHCMKGVKPLKFGEGALDCSLGPAATKGLMSRGRGNLLVLLELRWGGLRFLCRYPRELREPLVLPQGSQVSIRVVRGSAGLLWSVGRGVRPQITWKGLSQGLSLAETGRLGSLEMRQDLREPLILSLASQESF